MTRTWHRTARAAGLLTVAVFLVPESCWQRLPTAPAPWTEAELALIESLSLDALGPPPPDPSNAVADDGQAARMGQRLFFDPRLSGNGEVSCATCHKPELRFTDGLAKARAIGQAPRNTPSLVGAAYSPWLYWDGRKDSLWSQALSPLEDPAEHGGNRLDYARLIADDPGYRADYESLFGALPDLADHGRFPVAHGATDQEGVDRAMASLAAADRRAVDTVFTNIGKTIAAYERTLTPEPTRFDRYVRALADNDPDTASALFSRDEVLGLRLFIGRGRCIECHNGPLFTNHEFHNTGVLSFPGDVPDKGRIDGLRELRGDPFNCLGDFSDDPARDCPELRFARDGIELLGAVRTPSLRNLTDTGPYMHKGQHGALEEALAHYNRAPPAMIGHNEAKPLGLGGWQLAQLEAFLDTLSGSDSR